LWQLGFVVHHAPMRSNPYLPTDEIDAPEKNIRPEIAAQELSAEFVDQSGASIFLLAHWLQHGEPISASRSQSRPRRRPPRSAETGQRTGCVSVMTREMNDV
jgi:hypothetical protein